MTDDETTAPAGESNEEKNETGAAPRPPAAAAAPSFAPQEAPAENNIAHILEEVKLPERRDFKAAADRPLAASQPEPAILEERIVAAASGEQKDATPEAAAEAPSPVFAVRTLKDDLQTVVREQKISLVRAVSLEEEKKKGQERIAPEQDEIQKRRRRRATGILFASAMLVLLGFGAIFGVIFVMQQKATPSSTAVSSSSILFAEQAETLPLNSTSPQNLKQTIAQAEGGQLGSLGSITQIVPVVSATGTSAQTSARAATLAEFFQALGINPPQQLMNAIGPNFFFGIHVVDVNAPLFVIPVTSYENAFAGMLAWEGTMDQDLSPIFASVPATKLDGNGVPQQRTFQDIELNNYDVRALEDDSGNVKLYYSFPTPNILVIAQSTYSFTEILSRLQAAREL